MVISEFAAALKDFLLVFQTMGPWGVVFFLWWDSRKEAKKWEERFIAMKQMYENNVVLVKNYDKISSQQQDLVIMNTQAITELSTILKAREG